MIIGILFLVAATGVAPVQNAGAIANAETLCMVMDNTRSIAPCMIEADRHIVSVNLALKGETADALCGKIRSSLEKQRMFFDGDNWTLEITSPAAGKKMLARCELPQKP